MSTEQHGYGPETCEISEGIDSGSISLGNVSTTREKDKAEALRRSEVQIPSDFADGCAHRDRQWIAFLRAKLQDPSLEVSLLAAILEDGECGEHVK
jgi:hypothetical protein